MFIGDVELPIVSEISPQVEAEVDEIKPLNSYSDSIDSVPVKHESSVTEIVISGFVNSETHSEHLSIEEQKQKLKELRNNYKFENPIEYKDYFGYLLVEDIDFVDNPNSRIVNEVEIEARYFPWPRYYPDAKPLDEGEYGYWKYGDGVYS